MTTPVADTIPSVHIPFQWQTRVLLRSNEGGRYEIDRQVLMDGSAFFRNLFALPRPTEPEQDKVATVDATPKFKVPEDGLVINEEINIDATTKDLNLFADLMQQTVRFNRLVQAHNLELTLEEAVSLLALTDKYDCVATRKAVRARLAHLAKITPWEVLYIACEWDDVWMGRRAIAQLSDRSFHTASPNVNDPKIWARLEPLSHAWQVAFLRLYMPATKQGIDPKTHIRYAVVGALDGNFAIWADKFDPKKE